MACIDSTTIRTSSRCVGGLGEVRTLMERGVLVEPDTGRSYFTGYAYKTLYD